MRPHTWRVINYRVWNFPRDNFPQNFPMGPQLISRGALETSLQHHRKYGTGRFKGGPQLGSYYGERLGPLDRLGMKVAEKN